MTSSITSFPRQGRNGIEAGADIDKFATLFSPATPPASPTLDPTGTDSVNMKPYSSSRPRSYHHDRQNTLGSDSELGSFVSVSASEDPLSTSDFELPPPVQVAPVSDDVNHGVLDRKSSSLRFFGKFAQEAKEAAERNKRCVLDELLLHEDDPLYWLKDQDSAESNEELRPPSPSPEDILVQERFREGPEAHAAASGSLLDLDQNFFTSKPNNISTSSIPSRINSPMPIPRHSPTRSPTHPAPATLAPPVAITSTASSTPANEVIDPLSNNSPSEEHHAANRSNSYQTLSNLSSRWMTSLLSKSNTLGPSSSAPTSNDGSPSLDMLFNVEPSSSKPRARSSDANRRTTSHANTMPSTYNVQLSHGTPFGQHHLRTSPFAPHIYSPPSGAPGFAGEKYDWDKGFSAELRLEIERERERDGDHGQSEEVERGRQGREMVNVGLSESRSERHDGGRAAVVGGGSPVHLRGVGDLMEKKSGHVQLEGRKAITSVVLDVGLADMIRPHLPALARLPRKWTLLYSLDQHGISLNTLYTRCEFPPPRLGSPSPQGALLVVKDDGDALFGVWMGEEGVHPSHGKGYYGSGESFMWKSVEGKFEVFKWTGRNDYVALCEPEFISFGGGDGQYGLYLDESLLDGSSAHCPTFGNDPLCSPGPKKAGAIKFECVGLEVWSVGP